MRRRLTGTTLAALAALVVFGAAACGDDDEGGDGGSGVEHEFVPLDVGGPITKDALEAGDIDIALLFSSDGAIAKNGWVELEDDENLQPVDNFIPAIRTDATNDDVEAVLNAVSEALEVEDMQSMVAAVSIDGENPEDVAGAFLEENDLPGDLTASGSISVGSANFAESEIAAELYAGALEAAGMDVEKKLQFGARDVYIPALESGELDLIPEFVGTLLTFLDPDATATSDLDETTSAAREAAEEQGFTVLEPAPADSVNTFVVTQETADEFGLETISDLADVDEPLTLGGPPECPERPFCLLGLIDTYGLRFNV